MDATNDYATKTTKHKMNINQSCSDVVNYPQDIRLTTYI